MTEKFELTVDITNNKSFLCI